MRAAYYVGDPELAVAETDPVPVVPGHAMSGRIGAVGAEVSRLAGR